MTNGTATKAAKYDLEGDSLHTQVEPSASYWSRCDVLRTVKIADVDAKLPSPSPFPPNSAAELALLKTLYNERDDPAAFVRSDNPLSRFLRERFFFDDLPAGAIVRKRTLREGIRTGLELATLFEAETPGYWHRHVLNIFFDPRKRFFGGMGRSSPADLSPPMQALVWAMLETAISSALMAAWHYKWVPPAGEDGTPGHEFKIAYRPRPYEFDTSFNVLFDQQINFGPGLRHMQSHDPGRGPDPKEAPKPSPGTPRHPSYPSGHSTYSAAASYVLGRLFPDYAADFKKLATNIGYARLYGGVHWLSDHTFGQQVGEAVGACVIEQLEKSGILGTRTPVPGKPQPPEELRNADIEFGKCANAASPLDPERGIWSSKAPVRNIQQNVL